MGMIISAIRLLMEGEIINTTSFEMVFITLGRMEELKFNVLECRKFVAPCSHFSQKRMVMNYELDFYIQGNRTMIIDDRVTKIREGSVCFRRPGQIASSIGDYHCYILTLDFSQKTPLEHYLRNTAAIQEPVYTHPLIDALPDVFVPVHQSEIHSLYRSLAGQSNCNSTASHLQVKELLFLLNSDLCHKQFSELEPQQSPADMIAKYIHMHFQEEISLEDLSKLVHLNPSYLIREFKKQYGMTPIAYVIQQRLHYACVLLSDTDLPIREISSSCGYFTTSFFIRQFQKHMHTTPAQYRKQYNHAD